MGKPDVLPKIPDLVTRLRGLLAQIPPGRVTTYGTLAEALGSPMAARWVGAFMLKHDHGPDCPCHRVVRSDGRLGLYIEADVAAKAQRLRDEGVVVDRGAVDLQAVRFDAFDTDRPLEKLRQAQESLASRILLSRRRRIPHWVGGVDVSYPDPDAGTAAYVLLDTQTWQRVWSTTIRREIRFPYISSFLAFRELPILLDLLAEVDAAGKMAPVLLVDGSGILHPRHAGIAAHLGVLAGIPTVGVTKKLLCGHIEGGDQLEPHQSRPVVHDDRVVGVALRPTAGSRRPLFISPGHRTDVAYAERLVRHLLVGHRLPEPLYWADRLSRAARRR